MSDEIAKAVFGLLFASSTEALFIADQTTGRIVSANRRLAALLHCELDALVGTRVGDLLGDLARDVTAPGRYEDVAFRRTDGERVLVELETVWIDDVVYGQLVAFMARDLERTHAALDEARRVIETRNREIALLALHAGVGELVAGIAHHLNNPVGALASTIRRLGVEIRFLPVDQRGVLERLLARATQVSLRIESNVNAIIHASQTTAGGATSDELELPKEVATALASFVGRLDAIPTTEAA